MLNDELFLFPIGCATPKDPGVCHDSIVMLQFSPTLISVAGGMHIGVDGKYLTASLHGLQYNQVFERRGHVTKNIIMQ